MKSAGHDGVIDIHSGRVNEVLNGKEPSTNMFNPWPSGQDVVGLACRPRVKRFFRHSTKNRMTPIPTSWQGIVWNTLCLAYNADLAFAAMYLALSEKSRHQGVSSNALPSDRSLPVFTKFDESTGLR
ncbi:MAG: hypothetical protein R3C17_06830 [Planctomycetaceae bacterium]